MTVPHAHVGSVPRFLLCRGWKRSMCPVLGCVVDETECLFLRFVIAFRCFVGCGRCPIVFTSWIVKPLIDDFLAHLLMVALKLVKVGLSA